MVHNTPSTTNHNFKLKYLIDAAAQAATFPGIISGFLAGSVGGALSGALFTAALPAKSTGLTAASALTTSISIGPITGLFAIAAVAAATLIVANYLLPFLFNAAQSAAAGCGFFSSNSGGGITRSYPSRFAAQLGL